MDEKRVFTGIELPQPFKDTLRKVARRDIYWIKWMPPENFHITLNFLGDLDQEELETAAVILGDVVNKYSAFDLILDQFDSTRDMLWLLPQKSEALERLQWELKSELKKARIGKSERRHYIPHVLIAKSKTGRPMRWLPENFEPLKFHVGQVSLYESELTPGAATHTLIQSFALGNPNVQ